MTTDITELSHREKFEAWFVNDVVGADVNFPAFKDGEYAEGEIYDEQLHFMLQAMWMAWKSCAAELVEALEKAQATEAHCNRGWNESHEQEERAEAAQKRIAELDSELEREREKSRRVMSRIAELESRTVTVKLPDIMPPEAAPAHYWVQGESMSYADGYNKSAADLKTSIAQACSSAGVNVEFE